MRETWWLGVPSALESTGALGRLGVASVASAMAVAGAGRVLSSDKQSAAVVLAGPPPVFLKWRRVRGAKRHRHAFLRPSRERREAAAALEARTRGIATPHPLAVGERRAGGLLLGAVLVRPFFVDRAPLDRGLAGPGGPDLLARAAAAWRRWHDAGFRHGDAYPKNVLLGRDGDLWPIGFPAARFVRPGPALDRARRKDLAQWTVAIELLLGEEAPRAFLRAYAGDDPGALDLARRIARLAGAVRRRKARRRASRPAREPEGPPPPVPLPPDPAPPARRVLDLAALAVSAPGRRT